MVQDGSPATGLEQQFLHPLCDDRLQGADFVVGITALQRLVDNPE